MQVFGQSSTLQSVIQFGGCYGENEIGRRRYSAKCKTNITTLSKSILLKKLMHFSVRSGAGSVEDGQEVGDPWPSGKGFLMSGHIVVLKVS